MILLYCEVIFILLIWYPKCSTCQKAKKFLEEKGLSFNSRDIVSETPTYNEIKEYWAKSGIDLKRFFNTSGLKYRSLGLKDKIDYLSDSEKLSLLEKDGMLIKRPLLILEDRVLIGFKEKEWSDIFENS